MNLSDGARSTLLEIVGAAGLLPAGECERYEVSPNLLRGKACAVVRPADVAQTREVLRVAVDHGLKLVPQGANSGLVGAGIPSAAGDQVVLSTERMRGTFIVDAGARTLTASAGWTLGEIQERLETQGLRLPVEVGSSPSVGGMVASNTAGSNVVRYGDVRRRLLGVQAVVPDESLTVLDSLSPLRKRNEGLDMAQLLAGSGGRWAVVTAASFELARTPRSRATAWVSAEDSTLVELLSIFESVCAERLTAFELASPSALGLLTGERAHLLSRVASLECDAVLVEVGAPDGSAESMLHEALQRAAHSGCMRDATVGRPQDMWEVRHEIPAVTEKLTPVLSFDLSVPRSRMGELRAELATRVGTVAADVLPVELGHVGDGGLHYILPLPHALARDTGRVDQLRDLVYETTVSDFGGSFSAEHGVGPKNQEQRDRFVPKGVQDTEAVLKAHFDPHGVLGWSAAGEEPGR